MKSRIAVLSVIACAALLCLGLTACGGGSTTTTDTSKLTPAANLNPKEVDPGSIQDSSASTTSDIWKSKDGSGIYFTHSSGNAGRSVTLVDANGKEGSSTNNLEITSENHLKTTDQSKLDLDFLFYDEMNVYEAVSGTWYSRGNLSTIQNAVAGKTYVSEKDDTFSYTFNKDGSFVITQKGKTYNGTWHVINCEQIAAGEGNATNTYRFYISENGKDFYDGYILSGSYKYVLKK